MKTVFYIRSDIHNPDGSWLEDTYWSINHDWNANFKKALTFTDRVEADRTLAAIQNLDTPIRLRARVVQGQKVNG